METRNFNILVAAICVALTVFWLSAYNYVLLDIDPIEYAQESTQNLVEGEPDEADVLVRITGKVKKELKLSLSDIKSDDYNQVEDKVFTIVTQVEPHRYVYSGPSLWSILETEDILESDAQTFLFIGRDGYQSPETLSLNDVAKKNEEDVILAYEYNGNPISLDGPIRSVIDDDALPEGEYSSQYSVKNLVEVRIQ